MQKHPDALVHTGVKQMWNIVVGFQNRLDFCEVVIIIFAVKRVTKLNLSLIYCGIDKGKGSIVWLDFDCLWLHALCEDE